MWRAVVLVAKDVGQLEINWLQAMDCMVGSSETNAWGTAADPRACVRRRGEGE